MSGLGVHQVKKRADAKVAFQLIPLGGGESVVLVPCHQFVQAIEVGLLEIHTKQSRGGLSWQVISFGMNQPGNNSRFRAAFDTLMSCHNFFQSRNL